MADFFRLLQESGLLTAAFIIGAIAVFVAIVGSVKTIIELSSRRAFLLALFGLSLMALSVGGYFVSLQASPRATAPQPVVDVITPDTPTRTLTDTPTPKPPTDTPVPEPTNTPQPQPTSAAQVPTTTPPSPAPVQTATQPVSVPNDCSKMIEGEHHNPTLGVDWKLEAINEDRILHLWSNHWDPNLPEFKFFLPAGQSVSFKSGGGSEWRDRPGCDGVAEVLFQRDTFQEITFEQYQEYIDQKIIP